MNSSKISRLDMPATDSRKSDQGPSRFTLQDSRHTVLLRMSASEEAKARMRVASVSSPCSQLLDGSCESEDEDSEPVRLLLSAPVLVSEGPDTNSQKSVPQYT